MNHKVTHFPQYRMLSNGKTFYKIADDRHFVEIQLMGSKKIKHAITAEQYPEMLRIQDMLDGFDGLYLTIPQEKWEEIDK